MKTKGHPLGLWLVVVLAALSGSACEMGQARPGPDFDGSAKWGADLAQPRITAFAADAQLRAILGARIASDGRLFANVGTWSAIAFSASRQEKLEVLVSATGEVTESVTPATGAGIQVPLPATWLNSTDVFTRMRGLVSAFDEATLVSFNLTDFGAELAGRATWAINTPGGNALVLFDGSVARLQ